MDYKYQRIKPFSELAGRLKGKPNLIQVIMGPRQVGKTTTIKQFIETSDINCIYDTADLLSPPTIEWIETNWFKARDIAKGKGSSLLVLDEVQKVTR